MLEYIQTAEPINGRRSGCPGKTRTMGDWTLQLRTSWLPFSDRRLYYSEGYHVPVQRLSLSSPLTACFPRPDRPSPLSLTHSLAPHATADRTVSEPTRFPINRPTDQATAMSTPPPTTSADNAERDTTPGGSVRPLRPMLARGAACVVLSLSLSPPVLFRTLTRFRHPPAAIPAERER